VRLHFRGKPAGIIQCRRRFRGCGRTHCGVGPLRWNYPSAHVAKASLKSIHSLALARWCF
jgi:hypothetical protein